MDFGVVAAAAEHPVVAVAVAAVVAAALDADAYISCCQSKLELFCSTLENK